MWSAEFAVEDLGYVVERSWRHRSLELGQLRRVRGADEVAAGTQDLRQLDEGRAQILEGHSEMLRTAIGRIAT